jgi:hypothetical protein
MKFLGLAVGVVLAATAFLIGTSEAARLPGGSYTQSCWDISLDELVLTATCTARDGQPYESSLIRPDFCRKGVSNDDGQLRCAGQHPAGSYTHTCTNTQSTPTSMQSRCQRSDGSWNNRTTLADPWTCNGYIANKNGNLVCDIS